jgi:hypothetical protein
MADQNEVAAGLSRSASEAERATLSGLVDINSKDPIEGMIASQIIAAHEASMQACLCRPLRGGADIKHTPLEVRF